MALGDFLKELKERALPAVRSFGVGSTAGLVKYPAAGAMIAYDQLVGEGKLTPQEALNVINLQQQEDITRYPVTSTAAEMAGSIIPAAKIARAAKTIPQMAVGGATLGALSGFNQQQSPQEAITGAGLGAILGTVGGATGTGLNKSLRSIIKSGKTKQLDSVENALNSKIDELAALNSRIQVAQNQGIDASTIIRRADIVKNKDIPRLQSKIVDTSDDIARAIDESTSEEMLRKIARSHLEGPEAFKQGFIFRTALQQAKQNLPSIGLGGLAGGTGGFTLGGLAGGIPGAIVGGLAGPFVMPAVTQIPSVVPRTTAMALTQPFEKIVNLGVKSSKQEMQPQEDIDALVNQFRLTPEPTNITKQLPEEDIDALVRQYSVKKQAGE